MRATTSPYYSRNYGGLSQAQINFLAPYILRVHGPILDPMGGQAHYLSQLAHCGRDVHIRDLNPGPLTLALLRDPRLIDAADTLTTWLAGELAQLIAVRPTSKKARYSEEWVPDTVREQLQEYVGTLGLNRLGDPSVPGRFWRGNLRQRLAAALPVLCAREIACYTASDNLTWLKKGGLQTVFDIYPVLLGGLTEWNRQWVLTRSKARPRGRLTVECVDAEDDAAVLRTPRPSLIITSPPYANRLDYTRLWAPELEVMAAMFGFDTMRIKNRQIGTNVVRGKVPSQDEIGLLPIDIKEALLQIRNDELYASETYYYPFCVT